jgi:hypothetical protein
MVETKNDDSVTGLAANGLKSWDEPWDLTPVSDTHSGFPSVPMQMNMKDSFSGSPTVINSLHCPCQRIAANPCADGVIFDVLVIRDGMIAREEN